MSLPIRRARRRRHLGVTDLAATAARLAPEIELGWNNLLDELRDAGWPARSPEGDQKPGNGDQDDGNSLDYADPTGQLAGQLWSKHGDLMTLQDHLHTLNASLRALHLIANRHRPTLSPAVPGCTVTTCDEPVESRTLANGTRSYVGMEQIVGHWVAKPGCTPTCRRHRSRRERDVAA
jgi:hypothetical protein